MNLNFILLIAIVTVATVTLGCRKDSIAPSAHLDPASTYDGQLVSEPSNRTEMKEHRTVEESTVLIQEPTVRKAHRPDFSSGYRPMKNRSSFMMLQAFNDSVRDAQHYTVQVVVDAELRALGTIVDADGWIVTKSSELCGATDSQCVLSDQRELQAKLFASDSGLDIALLKIPATELPSVVWELKIPEQGRWLATTEAGASTPAAIGVVSAGPIHVPKNQARLGVSLENDTKRKGALVTQVLVGSAAYEAGLKEFDSIIEVDGRVVESRDQLLSILRDVKGGQLLKLLIQRDEATLEKRVQMMDLSSELLDETEMEVNGPLSARASDFARVFQHDSILAPSQCGGPLINLDGKAVGINIARAGRVCTYALPADTLVPALQRMLSAAKHQFSATSTTRPISTDSSAPFSIAP